MSVSTLPHHPIIPMAELVSGLPEDVRDLAIRGITTTLNRAHYLVELQEAARNASAAVEQLQHDHEPFRGNADPCQCCKAEARENEILAVLDGQKLLVQMGGRL